MKINKKGIGQAMLHILLCVLLLVWLYPIIFAVCNSFKTTQDALNHVLSLIPQEFTVDNYMHVFETLPFIRITCNTLLIALTVTAIKMVTSFMAAYGLVFFDMKGKGIVYFFMLSTMFIPFTVTMIPNYLLISKRRLLVSKACIGLLDEFGLYRWDDKAALLGVEKPVKENDHAMDALRYFVNSLPDWRFEHVQA